MKRSVLILYIIFFVLQCERGWLRKISDPNYNGCTDKNACNYNDLSYEDDGSCIPTQGCNKWCEGDSFEILEFDCAGECGGSEEVDECGVCDGSGIPDGACDCDGNVLDECCVCGGSGIPDGACDCDGNIEDEDLDGICDGNDGDSYETVQIGEQFWMTKNLKATHYKNGDKINTENSRCDELSNDMYKVYDNIFLNQTIYGNLYNWYAVSDDRGICPESFHMPTNDEWIILIDYLGGKGVAGGKMKKMGTEYWNSPNTGATNESGFTALPGGFFLESDNSFNDLDSYAYFWTNSAISGIKASTWILGFDQEVVDDSESNITNGMSVRCIKDDDNQ